MSRGTIPSTLIGNAICSQCKVKQKLETWRATILPPKQLQCCEGNERWASNILMYEQDEFEHVRNGRKRIFILLDGFIVGKCSVYFVKQRFYVSIELELCQCVCLDGAFPHSLYNIKCKFVEKRLHHTTRNSISVTRISHCKETLLQCTVKF